MLNHNWLDQIVQPTCTDYGTTYSTCSNNATHTKYSEQDPLGHATARQWIKKYPGCDTEGEYGYECRRYAGDYHQLSRPVDQPDKIPPAGHKTAAWYVLRAPTCDKEGGAGTSETINGVTVQLGEGAQVWGCDRDLQNALLLATDDPAYPNTYAKKIDLMHKTGAAGTPQIPAKPATPDHPAISMVPATPAVPAPTTGAPLLDRRNHATPGWVIVTAAANCETPGERVWGCAYSLDRTNATTIKSTIHGESTGYTDIKPSGNDTSTKVELAHILDNWVLTVPVGCDTPGERRRQCKGNGIGSAPHLVEGTGPTIVEVLPAAHLSARWVTTDPVVGCIGDGARVWGCDRALLVALALPTGDPLYPDTPAKKAALVHKKGDTGVTLDRSDPPTSDPSPIIKAPGHDLIRTGVMKANATCNHAAKEEAICRRASDTSIPATQHATALSMDVGKPLGHDWRWDLVYVLDGLRECQNTVCDGDGVTTPVVRAKAGVGDIGPGGGIIFYAANTTAKEFTYYRSATDSGVKAYYLELAPKSDFVGYTWGSISIDVLETSDAIGTGRKNTLQILEQNPTAPAALNSRDYVTTVNYGGGTVRNYNDWFLPSKGELVELYKAYKADVAAAKQAVIDAEDYERIFKDLVVYTYWSSTQSNVTTALAVDLNNPSTVADSELLYARKNTTQRIRPIRAF
jgi:hypothetical protein